MPEAKRFTLTCPVRGELKALKRSKDGLTPTEEYHRVQAIKFLIDRGYPKENFVIEPVLKRFGHGGRNSFRSDFAVLDIPSTGISDVDTILEHALLLCEVKRDNAKVDYVKQTQVKPMLDFAGLSTCLGPYWADVEQRLFWLEYKNKKKSCKEGPLLFLPTFGAAVTVKPLTFADTQPADSLLDTFSRIEDILHQAAIDRETRYLVMLQLLLAKIYDEHSIESKPTVPLGIQDYGAIGVPLKIALARFNQILDRAVSYYEKHLPKPISKALTISGDTLVEVLRILAPIRIIHSKRDVIQTFYMKFAKDLYKWDLAQYFTPTALTAFIVDVLNPSFGEHIIDPACGSADFLIAAFHIGSKFDTKYADCVWGVDNSSSAVQVAVLNMLLNGDGKGNIQHDDALLNIKKRTEKYDIIVCNPPFGKKITEKRHEVLSNFELGHHWGETNGKLQPKTKVSKAQETGILFLEACIRMAKPNGRIGIILPNGYLGNRSLNYKATRSWLLNHCKVVCIASLPRFTFKSSGADVSASVIYLEKRLVPLEPDKAKDSYSFCVSVIERVGWEAGNKRAKPVYQRNQADGSYLLDGQGEYLLECDFPEALARIRKSAAADYFSWMKGAPKIPAQEGWCVPITDVLSDRELTLDPKRLCEKVSTLKSEIMKEEFYKLGDLVDFIPEKTSMSGKKIKIKLSETYKYVELQDIGFGDYKSNLLKGWELPSRARHLAEYGDIYIGKIWGSVQKWCLIGKDTQNEVVTNGCHRCRVKAGKEDLLIELVGFLCTEAYAVQMRSLARGSDGLAEVVQEDAANIVIPKIVNTEVRAAIKVDIDNLQNSVPSVQAKVGKLIREKKWKLAEPNKRPSHIVLV